MNKIIHYCWFGKKALPESAKKCIKSWKKYFPDYKICEWNESNFDINCNAYVKGAYKAKKWAFVSDYARFWILYYYGGLYFDTDVEVIKTFEDIINIGNYMGCEKIDAVNPGLGCGAEKGLRIYKEILDYYDQLEFDVQHIKTVVDYTTDILKEYGFKGKGEIEYICDINIYPLEYFCPLNPATGKLKITEHTYSIHHYTATWQSPYARFKGKMQQFLGPQLSKKIIALKRKMNKKI